MIGKQVLAFGKSEKSKFINIGIFAASSGGRKGRRQIGVLRQIGRDHMYVQHYKDKNPLTLASVPAPFLSAVVTNSLYSTEPSLPPSPALPLLYVGAL